MIITLRDPYNGAEKLYNLEKFIHAYSAIDGGYEVVFEHMHVHMDYKEYERFKKAVEDVQKERS
jgi:hypothetical protein